MKKILLSLLAGMTLTLSAHAQTVAAGDIAFTSFNADEKGWTLVTFADIASNTTIYFTDNEWSGSALNGGEGFQVWNSGSSIIAAGTVIRFSSVNTIARSASIGIFSAAGGSLDLSATADTLYAYQGTAANAPTSFLSAMSSGTFGNAADGYLTGTGLSIGMGAVQLQSSTDYAEYTGARSGLTSFAAYKSAVGNAANWTMGGNGSFAATVPNTTNFSVTAVPEPETYALLLAGLGLIGAVVRRRNAA
jgi:hypothetical protein